MMTDLTAQIEGSRQHEEAVRVAREEAADFSDEDREASERAEIAAEIRHDALRAAKATGTCYFCQNCGRLITHEDAGLCYECNGGE